MNRKQGQTREKQSRSETIGWQKEDAVTILSNVFPLFIVTARRVATIYISHKNVPCVSRVSQEVYRHGRGHHIHWLPTIIESHYYRAQKQLRRY